MESSGEGLSTDATPTEADVAADTGVVVVVESAAAGEEVKPAPLPLAPPEALKRHIILLNDLEARMLKIGIKRPFQSAGKSKPVHACFGHNEQTFVTATIVMMATIVD